MSVLRQWVSVLAVPWCACGSVAPPLPSIASVEPSSMPADSRFVLTVEFGGTLPLKVDYGGKGAELIGAERVRIADRDFEVLETTEGGRRISVDIIPWLAVGQQDLQVDLQDGRQVVLAQGFDVRPQLNLTGFKIEPIGNQVRRQPFTVHIQAEGPDAALFQGRVIVRSTQGNVDPKVSDPFKDGVLDQEFTGDASTEINMVLIVEDYAGHMGQSNEFLLSRP